MTGQTTYVKRVSSTIKQGVDLELTPKTLLYGPNGAGKSTVIQSIELATTGTVSDMEGRERVSQPHALARLFSDHEKMLAECWLSDGTLFSWSTRPGLKEGSYRTPVHVCPRKVSWPVQEIEAILRGDTRTVASWLEQHVTRGQDGREELLASIPPEVRSEVRSLMKRSERLDFIALAKEARREARELRTRATRQLQLIEQMTQGLAAPMLDTERVALETRLASLPSSGMTQSEYDALRVEIEHLRREVKARAGNLPSVGVLSAIEKLKKTGEFIRFHRENISGTDCWVCGNETGVAFTQQEQQVEATRAELERRFKVSLEVARAEQELMVKEEALHGAAVIDPRERDEIVARLSADTESRRVWANEAAQRMGAAQMRARADHLTTAAKMLEEAGQARLERLKADFECEVSTFLFDTDTFRVDLDNARVGLQRGSELHSALCGGEETRVLLALAARQVNDSTPSVLAPRDRAWDQDTLCRVMTALQQAPGQVILMSTLPRPEPVPGWLLVDVR
jgi:energy-coupling factor transporter ATP-binding protein EcfA2